jgi:hypothetical protein
LQHPAQPLQPGGLASQRPHELQVCEGEQTAQTAPKLPQAAAVGGSMHELP